MAEQPPFALALARIPSGLFILTTGRGERATGMLTSFVQQVGFEPPTVCVAIKKERPILEEVRRTGSFCLAVLHHASRDLMRHFARGFEPGEAAFEGVPVTRASTGVPYPTASHAHLVCEVVGEADWSDHILVCGRVLDGGRHDDGEPMIHVRKSGLGY